MSAESSEDETESASLTKKVDNDDDDDDDDADAATHLVNSHTREAMRGDTSWESDRECECVCVCERERERERRPTVLSQMVTTMLFPVLWVGFSFQQLNMCFTWRKFSTLSLSLSCSLSPSNALSLSLSHMCVFWNVDRFRHLPFAKMNKKWKAKWIFDKHIWKRNFFKAAESSANVFRQNRLRRNVVANFDRSGVNLRSCHLFNMTSENRGYRHLCLGRKSVGDVVVVRKCFAHFFRNMCSTDFRSEFFSFLSLQRLFSIHWNFGT